MEKLGLERSSSDLNLLTQRLNAVCRTATLDFVIKVGSLVIDELYDGDIEAWRQERGRRGSYRALVSREDLVISPTTLSRSVGTYVLLRRLGREWRHLSVSHLHEVLPLEASVQEALLDSAETEIWSVARLRQEVRLARPESPNSPKADGANPRIPELAANLVDRLQGLEGGALFELDDATAGRAREVIAVLRNDLQRLEALLSRYEARCHGKQVRSTEDSEHSSALND